MTTYDYINGTVFLESDPDSDLILNTAVQTETISYVNVTLKRLKSFTYTATNITADRYVYPEVRLSKTGANWTHWIPLDKSEIVHDKLDPKKKYFVDIRFTRKGAITKGNIVITSFKLVGSVPRKVHDGENTILLKENEPTIIKPPFIYKVFKITDLEILTNNLAGLDIKYRFSQDRGRSISEWEPLTKANITTVRINPIRFFQIEYLVTANVNGIKLYDINLIGDYQNVTADGQKTNLYGIRENCCCLMLGLIDGKPEGNGEPPISDGNVCDDTSIKPLTDEQTAQLYNPYDVKALTQMIDVMSNDIVAQFGHDVIYALTDPDKNGTDHTLHEHQLYNVVCMEQIKVVVDQNVFPDGTVSFNTFALDLFDTFEIQITKSAFKKAFGVEKRPGKEDIIWFCNLNRLYQVEHAQPLRTFNNASFLYKVILKKYNQKANVKGATEALEDKIFELTKNTTLDELMSNEMSNDKKEVANKPQQKSLTLEPIRQDINCDIYNDEIVNSSNIIADNAYNLHSVAPSAPAVVYKHIQPYIKTSDNICYTAWFNINNYKNASVYNFFNYFDTSASTGIRFDLQNDVILYTINSTVYSFNIPADTIIEDVWYGIVININNRQRHADVTLYKRNVDFEYDASYLNSTKLKSLWTEKIDISVQDVILDDNIPARINGSDMKLTNIRLFNDVMQVKQQSKLLNQRIVGVDSDHLILADNANKHIVLPFYRLNNPDDNIPDNYF